MKKIVFAALIVVIMLISACSNTPPATDSLDPAESATLIADLVDQKLTASASVITPTSYATEAVLLNTSGENAISIELQLLLGTIKLEGTEYAITKEQAYLLLPFWTNLKTISESQAPVQGSETPGQPISPPQTQTVNTEARAQIDALSRQIQAAMTTDQIAAFAGMQISQETVQTLLQEYGITMNNPQQRNNNPSLQGERLQDAPPTGEPGAALPVAGMQPRTIFIPAELIDMLVQLLEDKAAS